MRMMGIRENRIQKNRNANMNADARPWPEIMRPAEYFELVGQEAIWSENSSLRNLVKKDRCHSLVLWGPAGCGKTSMARLVGGESDREMICMSAVGASVKDIRYAIEQSVMAIQAGKKAHILFLDEVHRLRKDQQDVFLPAIEAGDIRFIGATTENPSFSVNNALLSRSMVFRLAKLGVPALTQMLKRAIDKLAPEIELSSEVIRCIAEAADGDGRRALLLLEALVNSLPGD